MKSQRFRSIRALSPRRVYFGWWVTIAGAFNMVFSAAPTFQAASVLFKAIEDEFGWSRHCYLGHRDIWAIGRNLAGAGRGMVDRHIRVGKDGLVGFTVGGAGLILFSRITGPMQAYFAFLILSIGFSVGGFTPSLTATNAWMINRRATAMSIVEGGVSVAGLTVPLIVWGISEFGWRTTVLAMGIIAILVGPLVARFVGKRPKPEQLVEQVRPHPERRSRIRRSRMHDFTPRDALRTRAFWSIAITHMLVNLSTGAISAHLFLHLSDDNGVGLDVAAASAVIPIMVATSFVAQLAGGIVGDMTNKRLLVPVLALVQGGSLVLLAMAESFFMAAAFACGVGRRFRGANADTACDAR